MSPGKCNKTISLTIFPRYLPLSGFVSLVSGQNEDRDRAPYSIHGVIHLSHHAWTTCPTRPIASQRDRDHLTTCINFTTESLAMRIITCIVKYVSVTMYRTGHHIRTSLTHSKMSSSHIVPDIQVVVGSVSVIWKVWSYTLGPIVEILCTRIFNA